jgi:hypothetical protein
MATTIDGIAIATPHKFKVERYPLTVKVGRTASGLMTGSILAWKRKFTLHYNAITGADLKNIIDLLTTTTFFHTFVFPDEDTGADTTVTVYPGAISDDYLLCTADTKLYTDIEFALIEQ